MCSAILARLARSARRGDRQALNDLVEANLGFVVKVAFEYRNLAENYPDKVAELARAIHDWRSLYPVAGTRGELVPPPGWRAPKDWAGLLFPLALVTAFVILLLILA